MLRSIASLSLPVSDTSRKKPIVIHHHNQLTLGGTEGMCQIFLKHFERTDQISKKISQKSAGL